jgi:hypothetical protein
MEPLVPNSPVKPKLTEKQIVQLFWERGDLKYKIKRAKYNGIIVEHKVQLEMYDLFYNSPPRSIMVWLLSRQTGKSVLLVILALEQCLRKKKSIVKMLTDTKTHMETILMPIFDQMLEDCPVYLKPAFDKKKQAFVFPNGSEIQLAGTDNKHYRRLRGQKCELWLVDEAGFCSDLDDAVRSVLIPTTTHTKGRGVLSSTPPEEEYHDFHKFIEEAEYDGFLTKKTIFDNPLLTKEDIDSIIRAMGGTQSERFRREYLCEIIRSMTSCVIPEFTPEAQAKLTKEVEKPSHYDCFVSMDPGGKDLTGVLFGYYDFRLNKVVIVDEIARTAMEGTIGQLATDILIKEKEHFSIEGLNEVRTPKRVSDINYYLLREFKNATNDELSFSITKKDDKMASVNFLREVIVQDRLIIHPRCEGLLRQGAKEEFERTPKDGHYDLVDALLYMLRNIDFRKNPYPNGYDWKYKDTVTVLGVNDQLGYHNNDRKQQVRSRDEVLSKIFGGKKK